MFTKDDLKTGMFVKLRNNMLGVIVHDDILLNTEGYMFLNDYTFNLKCNEGHDSDYDIIEVRSIAKDGQIGHHSFSGFPYMHLEYKEEQFAQSNIQNGDVVVVEFKVEFENDIDEDTIKKIYYAIDGKLLPCDRRYVALKLDGSCDNLKVNDLRGEIVKVYRPQKTYQYDYLSESEIVYERGN